MSTNLKYENLFGIFNLSIDRGSYIVVKNDEKMNLRSAMQHVDRL